MPFLLLSTSRLVYVEVYNTDVFLIYQENIYIYYYYFHFISKQCSTRSELRVYIIQTCLFFWFLPFLMSGAKEYNNHLCKLNLADLQQLTLSPKWKVAVVALCGHRKLFLGKLILKLYSVLVRTWSCKLWQDSISFPNLLGQRGVAPATCTFRGTQFFACESPDIVRS